MKKKSQPPTGIVPQSAVGYEPTHIDESIVLEVSAEVSNEEEAVIGVSPEMFAKPKKAKRVSMTDGGAKQLNEEDASAPVESDKSAEEVAPEDVPVVEEKEEKAEEVAAEPEVSPAPAAE